MLLCAAHVFSIFHDEHSTCHLIVSRKDRFEHTFLLIGHVVVGRGTYDGQVGGALCFSLPGTRRDGWRLQLAGVVSVLHCPYGVLYIFVRPAPAREHERSSFDNRNRT